MSNHLPPKAIAWHLVLRWTIALIFFANGITKFYDPSFGADAVRFFSTLSDDVIASGINPYSKILDQLIIPNAYIFASFVKYSELFIAAAFLIGFPLRIAAYLAVFLHLNYLMIASVPTFIHLNLLMMVSEFTVYNAEK